MPLETKLLGRQTIAFSNPPKILGYGNAVGKKEYDGPLGAYFDYCSSDDTFEEDSWEKSESAMQTQALCQAMQRVSISPGQIDFLFGGDLLNQCIATAYCIREQQIPFFGLYGACSTMAESLILAAMSIDGGFARRAVALTSSHFCSAERQYRSPLAYGGQRAPTVQWTATGSGAVVLSSTGSNCPYVTHATVGKITDKGITDAGNMGAAMAPAAYHTLCAHFEDTGRKPEDYDLIVTGDLGALGKEIVLDFFSRDGVQLGARYDDCGVMLYDLGRQDVHAGASGCGCSAVVLTGFLLREMQLGKFEDILFCGTGALHSPVATNQGESIPGICHAVAISRKKGVTFGHD